MIKILVVLALVQAAMAAPQGAVAAVQNPVQILRYENDNSVNGYNFAYETSDGVARQEQGELKNVGTENEALVVRGSVKWVAADGKEYTLNYVADENGYQPTADHLPKA